MIGIIAPYGRNEATAAAIRLADLIEGTGSRARFVACGVHERGIHPHWDREVRSARHEQLYFSLTGAKRKKAVTAAEARCRAYVHFVCDKRVFNAITLIDSDANQILVPNWTTLTSEQDVLVKQYTRIVCPSKACYKSIKSDLFGSGKVPADRLSWLPWDAGINGITREGTVADGVLKILFQCDHTTIDYCGPTALRLVDEVLSRYPKVTVTLGSTKSWAKNDRRTITNLKRRWEARFATKKINTTQEQMTELHAHDWVVCPAVTASFGTIVARAVACGVPVIAHDVEPFGELILSEHNGLLVDCEINYTSARAPLAQPDTTKWLTTLDRALRDNTLLFRMQCKIWKVTAVKDNFDKFWRKALSI